MTSHDHLFKSLFREFFRELLLLVEPNLAARLGLGAKVEFHDKEMVPESTREDHRLVDLLATIPDPAEEGTLLVHLEIEHRCSKRIGQRLWRYSIHLRARYPEPLASLVVFLRGGPPGPAWNVHVEETAGREVNRFHYLSFGLSKLPAEELLARTEPLAWGLAALAKPGKLGRPRLKLEALRKIAAVKIREHHRMLLVNCVETYLPLNGREAQEYASLCSAQKSPEMKAMQLTWADRIEAKGVQKGLQEGRERGQKEGRERGLQEGANRLRRTVLRLLRQRFGRLPLPLRKSVAAIRSVDELGAIADRILEVGSIEELGLGG